LLANNLEDLLPDRRVKRQICGAARGRLARRGRVGREHGDVLLVLTETDDRLITTPISRRKLRAPEACDANHPKAVQSNARNIYKSKCGRVAKTVVRAKQILTARQHCVNFCRERGLRALLARVSCAREKFFGRSREEPSARKHRPVAAILHPLRTSMRSAHAHVRKKPFSQKYFKVYRQRNCRKSLRRDYSRRARS
jgi:hypothetical protein